MGYTINEMSLVIGDAVLKALEEQGLEIIWKNN